MSNRQIATIILLLCPSFGAALGFPRQQRTRTSKTEAGAAVVAHVAADAGPAPLLTSSNTESVEINLDLPPFERWQAFARKERQAVISKCKGQGEIFQRSLGPELVQRWLQAAHLDQELKEEFEGIRVAVNHSAVTTECLIITDMWQAVDSPSFECTGLLVAMPNGTVLHGRNIDYDTLRLTRQAIATGVMGMSGSLFDFVLTRGGQPIAEFLGQPGSVGTHTGMRFGAYSVNSNARLHHNGVHGNLEAAEAGGRNFPWVMRLMLQRVPDFQSAVRTIEVEQLNAPNYFIFAGAGPFEGAIVTKDRMGMHNPLTPPTQRLDPANGVWYLVQTNDDLLQPAEDARRGTALARLAKSNQAEVNMAFVERQMLASPTMNSDTLITWMANPQAGSYYMISQPGVHILRGMVSKAWHRALNIPMPQDLPA